MKIPFPERRCEVCLKLLQQHERCMKHMEFSYQACKMADIVTDLVKSGKVERIVFYDADNFLDQGSAQFGVYRLFDKKYGFLDRPQFQKTFHVVFCNSTTKKKILPVLPAPAKTNNHYNGYYEEVRKVWWLTDAEVQGNEADRILSIFGRKVDAYLATIVEQAPDKYPRMCVVSQDHDLVRSKNDDYHHPGEGGGSLADYLGAASIHIKDRMLHHSSSRKGSKGRAKVRHAWVESIIEDIAWNQCSCGWCKQHHPGNNHLRGQFDYGVPEKQVNQKCVRRLRQKTAAQEPSANSQAITRFPPDSKLRELWEELQRVSREAQALTQSLRISKTLPTQRSSRCTKRKKRKASPQDKIDAAFEAEDYDLVYELGKKKQIPLRLRSELRA